MTTKPKTVPELRFPGFDSDWIESSLGDAITSLDAGVSVNSEDTPTIGDELGIMKTSCVTKGYFDAAENKRVIDPIEINRLKEPVSKDSIVISRMNTPALVGLSGLVPQDENRLFLPDRLWAAKISSNHDPRWIAQLLASEKVRIQLSDRASGTSGSMKNITKGNVLSLPVSIPTLPEQRKIADFLTAVDGRIGQLSQKKALLEDYRKGVMQQLFTQALRFKDDHGNDFPEWEEKTLGEIGKITTGKTPSTSDDAAWIGDTMFVTPTDIGEDTKFQRSTKRHVNGEKLRLIPKHSLMFTCIASVGKMSIATEPCITNQQINSVSVNSGYFFEFIYYALRHLTPKIKATQANTTLPIINKTEFSKFLLPIPSFPEQIKIAKFLTALDRKIESVSQQITHTQAFKKGLLQQMFV